MINDIVKESAKNKEWIKKQIESISKNTPDKGFDFEMQDICWKYYFNEPDEEKHQFLLTTGDNNRLPVYYYHIPLQRTLIDTLVSQQVNRPYNFSIALSDKDSVSSKYENQIKEYLKIAMDNANNKLNAIREYSEEINLRVQQIEEQIKNGYAQLQEAQNSGQEVDPRYMQMISQMESQLPLIKKQAQKQLEQLSKQSVLTEQDVENIKKNQLLTYRDIKEIIGQKTMIKLREELKIEQKSKNAFISKVVAGASRYFVYYDGKTKLPQFNVLNPKNVIYPKIESISNISKCPWVKIKSYMSLHSILNNYGVELEKEYGINAISELTKECGYNDGQLISFPNNAAVFLDDYSYTGNSESIVVDKIFFLSNRKITIKYSPNLNSSNSNDVFRHFIDPNKEIIKKEDYNYKSTVDENSVRKSYYINKKNPNLVFNADEVELYSEEKKESYTEKYTTDRYEGVVINGKYLINVKKSDYVIRNVDDYSDVNLPVFGPTFSSISEQPYSLIKATMDIQDLYDIVYMQRQLMIALSGTKGNVIDKSQKPHGMSEEEWEHNMKMGRLYIQTKDEVTGQTINSSYNQWQSFDNTLSASVQYLNDILMRLEETAGNIVGVGRQRQGKVVPSDQVATFEMSIQQNELVTEVLFYDHDMEEAEAMTEALHLALRYCYINGDIIDIQTKDFGSEIIQIPPKLLNSCQMKMIVMNNTKEERLIKDIRNLIMNQWKGGQSSTTQLIDAMTEDSLTELKVKVRYWEEKSRELASLSANAERDKTIEIERAKAEFKSQLEKDLASIDSKIKENGQAIENKRLEIESQLKQRDLEIKLKALEDGNKLKLLELVNEDKIESGMLMENKEARIISNRLDEMQIKINAMLDGLNLSITKDKNDKSHVENLKKVEVAKAKKMNSEHLNDN